MNVDDLLDNIRLDKLFRKEESVQIKVEEAAKEKDVVKLGIIYEEILDLYRQLQDTPIPTRPKHKQYYINIRRRTEEMRANIEKIISI